MDVVGRRLSRLLLGRSTAYFQGRLLLVSRRVTCIFEFAKLNAAASKRKVGKIVLCFSPSVWYCWWVFHKIRRSPPYRCIKGLWIVAKNYQPQLVPSVCLMAFNIILEHLQFKENPWKICRFSYWSGVLTSDFSMGLLNETLWNYYCWWLKSGFHQLRLVVYPIIYKVYTFQVVSRMSSINSTT